MRYILIFMLFLLSTFLVNAQNGFGVIAGFNLSKMTIKDPSSLVLGGNENIKPVIRYQFGVYKEFHASKNIIISPTLLFIKKGYKTREEDTFNDGPRDRTSNFSPSYIQLPIDVTYRWQLDNGKSFDAGISLYISYGIGGKGHGITKLNGETVNDEKFKLQFRNETKITNADYVVTYSPGYSKPIDLGGGVVFKYEFGNKIGIKFNGDHSFFNLQSKINGKKSSSSKYNQQLRLSLCYDL